MIQQLVGGFGFLSNDPAVGLRFWFFESFYPAVGARLRFLANPAVGLWLLVDPAVGLWFLADPAVGL